MISLIACLRISLLPNLGISQRIYGESFPYTLSLLLLSYYLIGISLVVAVFNKRRKVNY